MQRCRDLLCVLCVCELGIAVRHTYKLEALKTVYHYKQRSDYSLRLLLTACLQAVISGGLIYESVPILLLRLPYLDWFPLGLVQLDGPSQVSAEQPWLIGCRTSSLVSMEAEELDGSGLGSTASILCRERVPDL
jgi:hypothetical protein